MGRIEGERTREGGRGRGEARGRRRVKEGEKRGEGPLIFCSVEYLWVLPGNVNVLLAISNRIKKQQ